MYRIAIASDEDKRVLFRNTAGKMQLNEAIVEKDFWVCLLLDYLFHRCEYQDHFSFKGGTSLSKCYGLIERFSEDIDLIMDWRLVGYEKDEPWADRGNRQQDLFNKQADERADFFLKNTICPLLNKDLFEITRDNEAFYMENGTKETILFRYPKLFQNDSILQTIRIESGVLAAWTPVQEAKVTPYVAENYPGVFENASSIIRTASVERTFWEKATILHQEANRPEDSPVPQRYSRHYYDLYSIAQTDYKEKAFEQIGLLQEVARFKMKFYPRTWARYEDAKPGTLRLIPSGVHYKELENDYFAMSEMIYGTYPPFSVIMDGIEKIEKEINKPG